MAESTENQDSAQGKASEADREQIEGLHAKPEGTAQDNKDLGPRPTDLGEARELTKQVSYP